MGKYKFMIWLSGDSWHNFEHDNNATEKRIVVMFTLANKRYYR